MSSVRQPPLAGGTANPGWYPDPWALAAWRWWDGWQWTGWVSPPDPPSPPERLPGGDPAGAGQAVISSPVGVSTASPTGMSAPPPPPVSPVTAASPAQPVESPRRRRLLVELLVVLAIFPLPQTYDAVTSLVGSQLGEGPGRRLPVIFPGHLGVGFVFLVIGLLLPLAAGALVLYLLSIPGGDGGPIAIGLGGRQLKADLALILPVFFVCFFLPQIGVSVLVHGLGVHTITPTNGHFPSYYIVTFVLNGVVSGVVEELVVLGYLVRRLEQIGLRPAAVVLIAVAVRGSYHLYYGWGVLPILAWATVSVLVYRRYRRLGPFIVVHVLWDTGLILASFYGNGVLGVEAAILLPTTLVAFIAFQRYLPARRPEHPRPSVPPITGVQ